MNIVHKFLEIDDLKAQWQPQVCFSMDGSFLPLFDLYITTLGCCIGVQSQPVPTTDSWSCEKMDHRGRGYDGWANAAKALG
jgi:hypothetical protein